MPTTTPFAGPESLRVHGEWTTFAWTLLCLPITVAVIGWVFQHQISWQELALLVIVAMIYVAFARGRLLGGGLRVHAGQFAHIHAVVEDCARMLRMPTPHVFIRDDPFVPCVAVGIGEPYAIVISAQYVDHFGEDELRFLVGRELGHIASGHTRFTSLLSANGRENTLVAIAFGAWLRKIEYTADRVGLLCCGSLEAAVRAIAVSSFGHVGRKIDLGAFAEQLRELRAEPSLRIAEWVGANPYSTNRIAALHHFARDPLYLRWAPRFAENALRPMEAEPPRAAVYAGFWRRIWALTIDLVLIRILVPAFGTVVTKTLSASQAKELSDAGVATSAQLKAVAADPDIPVAVRQAVSHTLTHAHATHTVPFMVTSYQTSDIISWVALWVYAIVLVGLVGQTFGMMVSDLRVTGTERNAHVGVTAALGRYVALIVSLFAVIGWFSVFRRVQPYELWSKTRLISGTARAGS
ncbi:MAG: M48 family metalloprotease [Vulcanimicrobiaceae bacterium]